MRRVWIVGCALMVACASSRIPEALRRYQVLVEEPRDSQSVELARAMRAYGFRVRSAVRGGSGPTAALIYFTFREPGPGETTWLHVRLADTRSGEIVRAGSILLDSLTATPKARAQAAVHALLGTDTALVAP